MLFAGRTVAYGRVADVKRRRAVLGRAGGGAIGSEEGRMGREGRDVAGDGHYRPIWHLVEYSVTKIRGLNPFPAPPKATVAPVDAPIPPLRRRTGLYVIPGISIFSTCRS